MAHGLYENDWMLSTKQRPWHGIGTVVQDAPTSEDAIRIAKLNWTVEQFPIYANGKEIAGMFANVRSDTNETLGVVRNRYKIVQNNEAFNFVDGDFVTFFNSSVSQILSYIKTCEKEFSYFCCR